EVVAANCALGENSRVTVRAAAVTGAQSIEVQGMPAAGRDVAERVLRSALPGKVGGVGDSVTLVPRALGPHCPTAGAGRRLRTRLGMQWSTTLLTVTATAPDGVVSVQPTTDVRPAGSAGPRSAVGPATGSGAGPAATGAGTGSEATTTRAASDPAGATAAPAPTAPAIAAVAREDLVGVGDRAEVLAQW